MSLCCVAMVRIVYGVSGEGAGHASRAHAVLTHLEQRGHLLVRFSGVVSMSFHRANRTRFTQCCFDTYGMENTNQASNEY